MFAELLCNYIIINIGCSCTDELATHWAQSFLLFMSIWASDGSRTISLLMVLGYWMVLMSLNFPTWRECRRSNLSERWAAQLFSWNLESHVKIGLKQIIEPCASLFFDRLDHSSDSCALDFFKSNFHKVLQFEPKPSDSELSPIQCKVVARHAK